MQDVKGRAEGNGVAGDVWDRGVIYYYYYYFILFYFIYFYQALNL